MPWVTPSSQRQRFTVTAEDGEKAFLIVKHWIVWVQWYVGALIGGAVVLLAAHISLLGALMIAGGMAIVQWLWWYFLINDQILVTPENIFRRQIDKVTARQVVSMPVRQVSRVEVVLEGWGLTGAAHVIIHGAGDQTDITFRNAAGGKRLARHIQELTARNT